MIELDDLKVKLNAYQEPLKELQHALDLEGKNHRIEELERSMEAPDFWNDAESSTRKTKELKSLKDDVAVYAGLEQLREGIEAYIELGITQLGARIFELKRQNYEFKDEYIYRNNRYGESVKFKKYSLV